MTGPPVSIDRQKSRAVYGAHYQIEPITNRDVAGGLKGKYPAQETVWHLVKS